MDDKEKVEHIFRTSLRGLDPSFIIKSYAERILSYYSMKNFQEILVAGFGKASYQMAVALEESIDPGLISDGIVITKYGHAKKIRSTLSGQQSASLKKIKEYEAAHPVPDENGIRATEEIVRLLQHRNEKTLVICLISGGGSALIVSPVDGISLSEKQEITDLLIRSGADIKELNAVRKHISKVKGGRLAELAYPAETISLMISDVVGDHLDVIASGPTAPDSSSYAAALDVIKKYSLEKKAPGSVLDLLKRGSEGSVPDTTGKDNPVFNNVQNIIVGSNRTALETAKNEAVSMGFDAEIISSEITGEARAAGKWLAEKARALKGIKGQGDKGRKCLISGGETTVTVEENGKGGRNTELALAFAMEIEGVEGITFLSAGTDGTDGPTDATGAVVNGETIIRAGNTGLDAREYLDNNDSYNLFKETDSLLITGPTGTNVMDMQIVIL
jgi:hydroxypyruvate reductase/glycerate 2-kinase